MFRGSYELRIDEKGRVVVPIKFRGFLEDEFLVMRGVDECLFIFRKADWEQEIESKLQGRSFFDDASVTLQRYFLHGMQESKIDNQFRLQLSPVLRAYAHLNLNEDCTMVGANNRVEIWNTERWNARMGEIDINSLKQAARSVGITGLVPTLQAE